jgi:hypothetical protein
MEKVATNDQSNPLLEHRFTLPAEAVPDHAPPMTWSRVLAKEYVPKKPLFTDEDSEIDFYARSPFTAWEHALLRNRHHPKLWSMIKGSPFEWLYRERFGNEF